jgi:hypothetical protein
VCNISKTRRRVKYNTGFVKLVSHKKSQSVYFRTIIISIIVAE